MLAWYLSTVLKTLIHHHLASESSIVFDQTALESILPQTGQFLLDKEVDSQRFNPNFVQQMVSIQKSCIIADFLSHFFWLAVITWSFIEAIQLLYVYHFSIFEESEVRNILILLIGWMVPAALTVGKYICYILPRVLIFRLSHFSNPF